MESKRRNDQFAITDFVAKQPANDDAKAEAGEARPVNVAKLRGRKAKIGPPIGQDAASDAEPNPGSQNGEKSSPKEPFCVWGNAVAVSVTHILWFVVFDLLANIYFTAISGAVSSATIFSAL
jgi:hypothetical protein